MCTGRIDLSFILHAFAKGADGVIIGGCWPGECHYVTEGNYDALGNVYLCKRLLAQVGIDPERLRLEWIAASEGSRFAEVMNDFVAVQKKLGPIGEGEGIDEVVLKRKIEAIQSLVPYIKLVERERLRVPERTEEAYRAFFESADLDLLFAELIGEKLTVSQILKLLEERPLSKGEISQMLKIDPSVISRHINSSSRQGLIEYEEENNCFALSRRGGEVTSVRMRSEGEP